MISAMSFRPAPTLGLLLLAIVSVGPATAQNFGAGAEPDLRVDWSATTAAGQSAIEGYLVNTGGWWYKTVRLDIESLDANGAVVSRTTVSVAGNVPPGGRSYFTARLPAGATYRVSITMAERLGGGASQT